MAATITVVAGANTRVYSFSTARQQIILTAIERSGFQRDPNNTGTDMNSFEYLNAWMEEQFRQVIYRTTRKAAQQGVSALDNPLDD